MVRQLRVHTDPTNRVCRTHDQHAIQDEDLGNELPPGFDGSFNDRLSGGTDGVPTRFAPTTPQTFSVDTSLACAVRRPDGSTRTDGPARRLTLAVCFGSIHRFSGPADGKLPTDPRPRTTGRDSFIHARPGPPPSQSPPTRPPRVAAQLSARYQQLGHVDFRGTAGSLGERPRGILPASASQMGHVVTVDLHQAAVRSGTVLESRTSPATRRTASRTPPPTPTPGAIQQLHRRHRPLARLRHRQRRRQPDRAHLRPGLRRALRAPPSSPPSTPPSPPASASPSLGTAATGRRQHHRVGPVRPQARPHYPRPPSAATRPSSSPTPTPPPATTTTSSRTPPATRPPPSSPASPASPSGEEQLHPWHGHHPARAHQRHRQRRRKPHHPRLPRAHRRPSVAYRRPLWPTRSR